MAEILVCDSVWKFGSGMRMAMYPMPPESGYAYKLAYANPEDRNAGFMFKVVGDVPPTITKLVLDDDDGRVDAEIEGRGIFSLGHHDWGMTRILRRTRSADLVVGERRSRGLTLPDESGSSPRDCPSGQRRTGPSRNQRGAS